MDRSHMGGHHGHHGHHDARHPTDMGGHHGHHDARHPTVSGHPHSHLGPGGTDPNMMMFWHGCTLPCPRIGHEKIKELDRVCGPPDPSYEDLVEKGTLCPFPDGEAMLPVCHEGKYMCHLTNFEQAYRIREAYDPGFRGQKREAIDPLRLVNFSPRLAPRRKILEIIKEIICDHCGLLVVKNKASKRFYYCYKCKEHGRRYELCPSCHNRETHQSENRWFGPGMHPHYKYCSHKGLTLYHRIAAAYPRSPGLLRALCDHCSGVICCRGDQDA